MDHVISKEEVIRLSVKELKARLERCDAYDRGEIQQCDCLKAKSHSDNTNEPSI